MDEKRAESARLIYDLTELVCRLDSLLVRVLFLPGVALSGRGFCPIAVSLRVLRSPLRYPNVSNFLDFLHFPDVADFLDFQNFSETRST